MTAAIIATISITKGSGWLHVITRGFFGVAAGKAAQISSIERNNVDSETGKSRKASEAFRKNDGEIAAGWHYSNVDTTYWSTSA